MRTTAPLSAEAESASARHRLMNEAMTNAYRGAIAQGFSAASEAWLRAELNVIGRTHLEVEYELVEARLEETFREALRDASRDLGYVDSDDALDALSEQMRATGSMLQRELHAQTQRDVTLTLDRLRRSALERAIGVRAPSERGHSYWFRDRIGRAVASHKFARTIWRQTLLGAYVETYISTLADHGQPGFRVWHPQPDHAWFGARFRFDELDLEALRQTVFHPNAEALPRPFDWEPR